MHGERFKPSEVPCLCGLVATAKEPARRKRRSPQYRNGWEARFPPELWPAVPIEEEIEDRSVLVRLTDGSKVWAESSRYFSETVGSLLDPARAAATG